MLVTASLSFRIELRWLTPAYLILLICLFSLTSKNNCKPISINYLFFNKLNYVFLLQIVLVLTFMINSLYALKYRKDLYFGFVLNYRAFQMICLMDLA